ncbi:SH3 domain-containing protein [Jannaschia marina]|uniref:SH3 domain-containing protein n=1 Tax=Jannaschia marina TaxID=2741674 RepID=UPI0015C96C35|nr:SH3 domain-containing protein [Jannaschia marina]
MSAALRSLLALLILMLPAMAAAADQLRNTGAFGVAMRAGPGQQFPMLHVLGPGETGAEGRCDLDGRWCLLTVGARVGWVDTTDLVPQGSALATSDPFGPRTTPQIESSPLDGPGRPLPGSVLDAVERVDPRRPATPPPGTAAPMIFSTTEPFRNVTDGLVNLRAGPGTDTAVVGELRPGEGGPIDVCDTPQQWCRVAVAGRPPAWVKMTFMGLQRHAVAPLAPGDRAR